MPQKKREEAKVEAASGFDGIGDLKADEGFSMSAEEFGRVRARLGRSQRELATLLGLSLKAVESYEQGWRKVPSHAAKTLYFLLFKIEGRRLAGGSACWELQSCPEERRSGCVAYLAGEGRFCWFFTGKLCARAGGCASCPVFAGTLAKLED